MPRQTSVQLTEATERQVEELKANGFGNLTDIIRIAIDRMWREDQLKQRKGQAMYTVQWEAQTENGFQSDVVGKYDIIKYAINVAKAFAYGGTRRDGDLVWEEEGVDEDTIVYVTDPNGDTVWTSEGEHADTEVEVKE